MKHRSILFAALAGVLVLGAASPAFADWHGGHGWRGGGWHGGGWHGGGWHGGWVRGRWAPAWGYGYGYGYPYYSGPRVYYAPPPVYYGYPAPSLTVTIP